MNDLLVFRLPRSTDEGVGDGMSELALVGGAGGGGEEAVISISSPPDGLVALVDGIGAVETIVILGLSKMP